MVKNPKILIVTKYEILPKKEISPKKKLQMMQYHNKYEYQKMIYVLEDMSHKMKY